jgi:hypothetical protein
MAHISFWFVLMTLTYWEEGLIVAIKEIGLEINADKIKEMFMS